MTNKKFLFGILVMVLVFGLIVISCRGNRLEGTWVEAEWGDTITFGRNTVTFRDGTGIQTWTGSYTTSGSNITVTIHGERLPGTFSIDGDTLIITIDGDTEIFTRRR